MHIINVEIKARCGDPERVRAVLRSHQARFAGTDRQVDTYFRVEAGRLKLREGNIENALIHYDRQNESGPKKSDVLLQVVSPNSGLKEILTKSSGRAGGGGQAARDLLPRERQVSYRHGAGAGKFRRDRSGRR